MEFRSLGLAPPLEKVLKKQGFERPTPIQEKAIPSILEGRDVIGLAQTGTGKTAAFILPLLSLLYGIERTGKFRKIKGLVLTPTRELAQQIGEVTKPFSSATNLKSCVIVGGVSISRQFRDLRKGSDIVIGTPGRVEDHISKKTIDLTNTGFVVLDEADQMFDKGFLPSIKRILNVTSRERQISLFSATMPREIRKLVDEFMFKPAEIAVSVISKPVEKVIQKMIYVNSSQKIEALKEILNNPMFARILVFTRTKHGAEKLVKMLSKEGFIVTAIHGNKSQSQRQKSLQNFKNGLCPILVATDIAARGIDVTGVEVVINFDLPEVPESYVHRIGRTARAGASGTAISLCTGNDIEKMRAIEKLIKSKIKELNFSETSLDRSFSKGKDLSPRRPNKNKENFRQIQEEKFKRKYTNSLKRRKNDNSIQKKKKV